MGGTLNMLVGGILIGGIYSLVALGVVVIYKSSKVISFTQGGFVMSSAIVGWALMGSAGLPFWLGIPLTILVCGLLGMAVDRLTLRPIIGQPIMASILVTIAVAWLFESIALLAVGGQQKRFPLELPDSIYHIGSVFLPQKQSLSFLICIVLFLFFIMFYRFHRVGLIMRGTAEDHEVMQSLGVKVGNMFTYSWIIAAVSGSIGGMLLASMVSVNIGLSGIGWVALAVVLIGGLESVLGALILGPVIGILENLSVYLDPYVGGGSREVVPYVVLLLVLLIKPYGLFGLKRIERI